ncbi:hypothetical protein CLV24_1541 [Pontibacter ummariensis]|uniref:Uncharacterized protein n=1 Tax=Pontibacter ummariensis TaxID=1610492 RepID=A0A239LY09_9BACT|nr:hypothetical protein [Pontibacter ummariensis]PRY00221.1 hypothetical protein CLV24_1541 [Pontibacter ummariensis]SNT34579.1 hypothetical protein SAMN06296052_1544 [Pontibacter ummariensis]
MERDKNKKTNQNQGKHSTAKTDATYNREAEELRDSPTSSMNASTPTNVGTGGVFRPDENRDEETRRGPNTTGKVDKKDTQNRKS